MFMKKIHKSKQYQLAHVKDSCSAVYGVFFRESTGFFCYFIVVGRNLMTAFEVTCLRLLVKSFLCCYTRSSKLCWILKINFLIMIQFRLA